MTRHGIAYGRHVDVYSTEHIAAAALANTDPHENARHAVTTPATCGWTGLPALDQPAAEATAVAAGQGRLAAWPCDGCGAWHADVSARC